MNQELLEAYRQADVVVDAAFVEIQTAAKELHDKDALVQTAEAEVQTAQHNRTVAADALDAKTVGFMEAEKSFRRLRGHADIPKLIRALRPDSTQLKKVA